MAVYSVIEERGPFIWVLPRLVLRFHPVASWYSVMIWFYFPTTLPDTAWEVRLIAVSIKLNNSPQSKQCKPNTAQGYLCKQEDLDIDTCQVTK